MPHAAAEAKQVQQHDKTNAVVDGIRKRRIIVLSRSRRQSSSTTTTATTNLVLLIAVAVAFKNC